MPGVHRLLLRRDEQAPGTTGPGEELRQLGQVALHLVDLGGRVARPAHVLGQVEPPVVADDDLVAGALGEQGHREALPLGDGPVAARDAVDDVRTQLRIRVGVEEGGPPQAGEAGEGPVLDGLGVGLARHHGREGHEDGEQEGDADQEVGAAGHRRASNASEAEVEEGAERARGHRPARCRARATANSTRPGGPGDQTLGPGDEAPAGEAGGKGEGGDARASRSSSWRRAMSRSVRLPRSTGTMAPRKPTGMVDAVGPEQDPAEDDEQHRHHPPRRPVGALLVADRSLARRPLEDDEGPVVGPPRQEREVGAVPEAGERPDHGQVE